MLLKVAPSMAHKLLIKVYRNLFIIIVELLNHYPSHVSIYIKGVVYITVLSSY